MVRIEVSHTSDGEFESPFRHYIWMRAGIGIQDGLKIRCSDEYVGSSPTASI